MPIRIVVNGREVKNPHVKRLLAPMVILMVFMMMALVMFVILPLIGLAVGAGLALAAAGVGTMLIGVPIARARMRALGRSGAKPPRAVDVRFRDVRSSDAGEPDAPGELPESRRNDAGEEETF
ncbi:MAG: hypothetical protein JST22_02330 [Bacteroidetes bacterium]|nr:hypothetical protein [Bacteroidota bacterium]